MQWQKTLGIWAIFVSICLHQSGYAQPLSNGSKFTVTHQVSNATTVHVPTQPLFFESNKTSVTGYQMLRSTDDAMDLLATVFSIKGKLYAYGQEQVFNSADTAGLNTNEMAWLKDLINQPKPIAIKHYHAIAAPKNSNDFFDIEQEDAGKYFLPFAASVVKAGLNWSDSVLIDSSKTIHQYLITKIIGDQVFITVLSDLQIKTSFKQAASTIHQQLKGLARAERIYNLKTGLMLSETVQTNLSGSTNNGVDILPISIQLKASSVITWP